MDHQARPTPFTVIAFTASLGALGLSLCLALSYFLIGISRLGYIGSGGAIDRFGDVVLVLGSY